MTYADYYSKKKNDDKKQIDKSWIIQFSNGEEDTFPKGKMSKKRLVEEACKYAEDIAKANNYDEYRFRIQEDTNNWEEEDFDKKQYDWLSIKAKKYNNKYEISVYDLNTHEYLRNDEQKRKEENLKQKIKRDKERSDKEFKEKFGWMEELLENKKKIINPN